MNRRRKNGMGKITPLASGKNNTLWNEVALNLV